jgi:hypothetical protein
MSIKTLTSASPHISVQISGTPYIGVNAMAQGVGMMRYNTSHGAMEVYDGSSWINVQSHGMVSMNPESERALDWAIKQMNRMTKLEKLAEDNPTIADALASLKHAEEQLRLVEILCEEEEK